MKPAAAVSGRKRVADGRISHAVRNGADAVPAATASNSGTVAAPTARRGKRETARAPASRKPANESDDETGEAWVKPTAVISREAPTTEQLMMHADDLSSDDEMVKTTVGAIPVEWYKDYDHLGYDREGKQVIKSQRGDGIDTFLKSQDDPLHKWRIYDDENDEEIVLSKRDVQILRNMVGGKVAHPEFDPTSETYNLTDIYSRDVEVMPLSHEDEPKRRFVPSKWEVREREAHNSCTHVPAC